MRAIPYNQNLAWTRKAFRGDAAFARLELYEYLEAEGYLYAIRLPANEVLYREIEPLLTRLPGRPSNKPVVWHKDFLYQAGSWDRPRRVVAKIEHHKGELFPRVGFIVTNLRRKLWKAVKFYNGRGTAEMYQSYCLHCNRFYHVGGRVWGCVRSAA